MLCNAQSLLHVLSFLISSFFRQCISVNIHAVYHCTCKTCEIMWQLWKGLFMIAVLVCLLCRHLQLCGSTGMTTTDYTLELAAISMPYFTFIGAVMWEYIPKLQIWNFAQKFASHGRLVCTVFAQFSAFAAFTFLSWSLLRYRQPHYKHFLTMGAFSHKFSVAADGETTNRIRKSWGGGAKMGRTTSVTTTSLVGIMHRMPALDKNKQVLYFFMFLCFVFSLACFRMTKL